MHVIAAKAYAFGMALKPEFKKYQQDVIHNAHTMVNTLKSRGYKIVSNGTDNHMFLIDLRDHKNDGDFIQKALELAHITTNKNSVPLDHRSPFKPSGIRIGTPAITSRGMQKLESEIIANCIADILDNPDSDDNIESVKNTIHTLCIKFPVPSCKQELI